ncbi:GSFK dehydrogenase, partial [Centropus unirufus]|nr:GSFK dehydrogenase [Centropus unirufus]
ELRDLASKHPNLVLVKLDVADPSAISAAVKTVERKLNGAGLNLLINNAGIYSPTASLETADAEEMIQAYRTNAVGPMLMAQAFLPLLKKAAQESTEKGLSCSKAAIINISTVMGSIQKTPESFYKPEYLWDLSPAPHLSPLQADLTVDTSVQGLLSVLVNLSEKHSGTLLNWQGKAIPW